MFNIADAPSASSGYCPCLLGTGFWSHCKSNAAKLSGRAVSGNKSGTGSESEKHRNTRGNEKSRDSGNRQSWKSRDGSSKQNWERKGDGEKSAKKKGDSGFEKGAKAGRGTGRAGPIFGNRRWSDDES